MNDWAEAALAPLRKWLPDDPKAEEPRDLDRLVRSALGAAINADREGMWTRLAGKPVMYRHPSGVSFWVRLGDWMSMWVIRMDEDDEATRFLLSRLVRGGAFLDVGANTGWFALRAAARYRELGGGSVHAFEPQPMMFDLIRNSVEENGFGDIMTVHDVALGDADRTVWMGSSMNSGGSFVRLKEHRASDALPMRRLDSLDLAVDRVDAIKVDIEGAEPLFVNGAADFIARHRPAIYSEVHPRKLGWVSNCGQADYIRQVEALGYRTMGLAPDANLVPFDRSDLGKEETLVNVVFEPL